MAAAPGHGGAPPRFYCAGQWYEPQGDWHLHEAAAHCVKPSNVGERLRHYVPIAADTQRPTANSERRAHLLAQAEALPRGANRVARVDGVAVQPAAHDGERVLSNLCMVLR